MNMETKATPLDEQCKSALDHYNRISIEAMESHSLIPEAIESLKTLETIKSFTQEMSPSYMSTVIFGILKTKEHPKTVHRDLKKKTDQLEAVRGWFRDWVKPWMHCLKEENDNLPISKKRINQLEIILKGREAQTITEDDVGNINEILG